MNVTRFFLLTMLAIAFGLPTGVQAETKQKNVPRTEPGCIRACAGGRTAVTNDTANSTGASDHPAISQQRWTKTSQTSRNGLFCKWISDDLPPKEQWQDCANSHAPN